MQSVEKSLPEERRKPKCGFLRRGQIQKYVQVARIPQ
jgi:hypothetical protein